MPELKQYWIEIDDEHVKRVNETIYTKKELQEEIQSILRPTPVVLPVQPEINNTDEKQLVTNHHNR